MVVDDPLALQGGEAAQLHVEDGAGLHLVDVEQLHEAVPGDLDRVGAPDQGDDLVELVEGLEQGAQDVHALLRPGAAGTGCAGR